MVSKKKNPSFVRGWDRKIYLLSSLGKPHDAKQWLSGQIFLSHLHTHDRRADLHAFLFQNQITLYNESCNNESLMDAER